MAMFTNLLRKLYEIQGVSKKFDNSWETRTNQCFEKIGAPLPFGPGVHGEGGNAPTLTPLIFH